MISKQQQTWLPWCGCGREVELAAGWPVALLEACWCGAAVWWWKLEADLVLLSGGGSWKLMLIWCCCLVVEAGSWCWFGAAAWWWKLEADADLVLLPCGKNWKLRLICCWYWLPGSLGLSRGHWGVLICWFCCCCWWWKLKADADFFTFAQIWLETVALMSHKSLKNPCFYQISIYFFWISSLN